MLRDTVLALRRKVSRWSLHHGQVERVLVCLLPSKLLYKEPFDLQVELL